MKIFFYRKMYLSLKMPYSSCTFVHQNLFFFFFFFFLLLFLFSSSLSSSASSSSSSASSSSSSSSLAYGLYSLTSASFCFLPSSLDTHRFQIILNSLATLILVIQQNRAKKFTANYSVSRTQCTIFKGVSEIDLFKD